MEIRDPTLEPLPDSTPSSPQSADETPEAPEIADIVLKQNSTPVNSAPTPAPRANVPAPSDHVTTHEDPVTQPPEHVAAAGLFRIVNCDDLNFNSCSCIYRWSLFSFVKFHTFFRSYSTKVLVEFLSKYEHDLNR